MKKVIYLLVFLFFLDVSWPLIEASKYGFVALTFLIIFGFAFAIDLSASLLVQKLGLKGCRFVSKKKSAAGSSCGFEDLSVDYTGTQPTGYFYESRHF